jgi:hypothetical protein
MTIYINSIPRANRFAGGSSDDRKSFPERTGSLGDRQTAIPLFSLSLVCMCHFYFFSHSHSHSLLSFIIILGVSTACHKMILVWDGWELVVLRSSNTSSVARHPPPQPLLRFLLNAEHGTSVSADSRPNPLPFPRFSSLPPSASASLLLSPPPPPPSPFPVASPTRLQLRKVALSSSLPDPSTSPSGRSREAVPSFDCIAPTDTPSRPPPTSIPIATA